MAASGVAFRSGDRAQEPRECPISAPGWSVQGLLVEMAARSAHPAVMVVRGESIRTLSYAEIAGRARQLAFGLIAAGTRAGDAVVVYGPNSPEWIIVALAVGACGAMLAPVDDVLAETDAAVIVADSGARVIFTTVAHYSTLRLSAGGARCYLLDGPPNVSAEGDSWESLLQADPAPLPPVEGASALCLSYTSGTTGAPKAIVLSCDNIGVNVMAIASEREAGPDDRVLLPLPLHHSYPLVIGLLTPLTVGATVVLPEGVAGPQIVRASRLAGVTALVGVPRLYEVLLNALESRVATAGRLPKAVFGRALGLALWSRRWGVDAGRVLFRSIRAQVGPRLRVMICGGAKLDADVNRKLEALGWTVFAGYGLAETASVFTTNTRGRTRIGSAGKAVGDGEMRIAEADESGTGEILLRGSNITSGYRNNPDATKAAFTPDGWFRTGDLGYIDADGYLYVTGRAKEMIVLGGGKKVFPEPLEKIYAASPYIREIALLERAGDLVALVRPDVEAIKAIGITLIEDPIRVWISQAAQRLPPYQRLSGFVIVEQALPRTRLGKYRRFLLPPLYERALTKQTHGGPVPLSEADRAVLAAPTAAAVWTLLQKRYADKPLALDADLAFDLSIDSFDWMEIALELEHGLGVQLTSEMVAGLRTVRDLIVAVTGLVDGGAADGKTTRRWALSEEEAGWLQPTGPVANIVAAAGQAIDKLAFRWGFALHVDGIERVPRHGPFVVAPNHSSELDAFAIAAALPTRLFRRSYWAGDDHRMFSTAPMRLFSRVSHVFPVDERVPMAAVMAATTVLARGDILIWFPEGWVSPDGRLQRFRPGIGKLLTDVSSPVVPTYISGTFEAMPRGRRWPRRRPIRIVFGAPVTAGALEAAGTDGSREERIANALRDQVAALARSIGAEP
jgi:long-chain acyl-CoA synthetase